MKQTILLIKISSLGDILHLLPALSDACQQRPELTFHWVVEEAFAEIPTWHPGVEKVIPVALRRWRTHPGLALRTNALPNFWRTLRAESYDQIIDAQGLLKSACLARLARGRRSGFDRHSARESLAALFYQTKFPIDREQHALDRLRQLLASALHYPIQTSPADYGLTNRFPRRQTTEYDWIFLHGTTWPTKQWPESHWLELVRLSAPHGRIVLPWGTPDELARAERIARVAPQRVRVAEKGNLTQLAGLLVAAKAVVAVDTGPAHLAAALGTPVIGLYGPTNPQRTGTVGLNQHHLHGACDQIPCLKRICPLGEQAPIHPPCFDPLPPNQVWRLLNILSEG